MRGHEGLGFDDHMCHESKCEWVCNTNCHTGSVFTNMGVCRRKVRMETPPLQARLAFLPEAESE